MTALLTLARAWFVAGQPPAAVRPLGSFEAWSQIVGSILAFGQVDGFLTNLPAFYERADDDARQWEGFLSAWLTVWGTAGVTAHEVHAALRTESASHDALRGALP